MRTFTLFVVLLIVGLVGFVVYSVKFANPRVAQELRDNPNGSRAERVMLMTIGDRKTIPVNYLREGNQVFIGADGPWWREMQGEGQPVVMLIKGEILAGQARAIIDRPEYTRDVFKRLRPDVPKWLPDWLSGVLVEIELGAAVDSVQEPTQEQILQELNGQGLDGQEDALEDPARTLRGLPEPLNEAIDPLTPESAAGEAANEIFKEAS